jgi:hypothetical protein
MAPTPQCQCLVTATHPPLHHRTTGSYHTQRLLPTDSSMSHIKLPSPLSSTTVGFRRTAQQTGNGLAVHPLRHQRTPNLLRHPRLGTPSPLHLLGSEGASKKHVHNIPDSPTCLCDYHRRLFRLNDHTFCLHDIAAPLRYSISSLRPPPLFRLYDDHHYSVSTTTSTILSSTTSPHPCGTLFRLYDITASLRTFAVFYFVSTATPFVSTTSPRFCGPPTLSLRHRRTLAAHHFVSATTSTHFVSPTSPRLFGNHQFAPDDHPFCLNDIAAHLRFTHCLCGIAAPLRSLYLVSTTMYRSSSVILFGLYDSTPHHSTHTFYLSGISRTRGSVGLFVIVLACPKVVRLIRSYLRFRTVV